jgi:hypothetical protein
MNGLLALDTREMGNPSKFPIGSRIVREVPVGRSRFKHRAMGVTRERAVKSKPPVIPRRQFFSESRALATFLPIR